MKRFSGKKGGSSATASWSSIEHWAIALSGLALLLSGLFEMPMANRY